MIQYLYLGRVPYDEGLRLQAEIAALRLAGRIPNILLLLEHPPVLTLGRNAKRANVLASDALLAARGVTLHEINRGGDVTYHGPGQLVGYPIFDLRSLHGPRGGRMGPVDFVRAMEEALIRLCAQFTVPAGRIQGLTGVWCNSQAVSKGHDFSRAIGGTKEMRTLAAEGCSSKFSPETDPLSIASGTDSEPPAITAGPARKIAAIGIHVSRGITSHGFAFNLTTNLRDFDLIVPCGIRDHAVTSLEREISSSQPLPSLEQLAHLAALQFGAVFDEPVAALASFASLRTQALHTQALHTQAQQQFPAEDTPLQVPPEIERLHSNAERPIQA